MSALLFFDPLCQRPYDTRALQREAMGGTESSLTRIADALDALVVQHNRTETFGRYRPPTPMAGIKTVVINRDSRALPLVRRLYPGAQIFLWVHDRMEPGSKRAHRLASTAEHLREMSVQIVCVSDSQRQAVDATLRSIHLDQRVRSCTIYNPVDDALEPDGSPVDASKLVFFSSPNKGLKFALDAFRAMRARMPDLRLVVGNPGYKHGYHFDIDGVTSLGAQPQHRLHAEVRNALCTFAPNFLIPETFGLVFAESLALGTPVLTYDCGAAREVIGDSRQLLPVPGAARAYETLLGKLASRWRAAPARMAARLGLFDAYIDRIAEWRAGARPRVGPDPRFRLTHIAEQWRALLHIS
jgi:glycosyltransferase involved in cell wall biosynthesis